MSLRTTAVSSSFSSIQAFQTYFQDHDGLFVPANQALEIKNISVLTCQKEDGLEAKEIFNEDAGQFALYLLCKMVLPLAKTIKMQFASNDTHLSVRADKHFYVSCSQGMTLKTQNGPIYTRLTDLFRLMIASSIFKVEFAPNQEVNVLGITEIESELKTLLAPDFNNIFVSRTPIGFSASLHFEKTGAPYTFQMSVGEKIYGSSFPQRTFTIQSPHKWDLSLIQLDANSSQSTPDCTETPVIEKKSPPKTKTSKTSPPHIFSIFFSVVWSILSYISRFFAWMLGR